VYAELVTDDGALPGLAEAWSDLLSRTPEATGFQSLAWVLACRRSLGSDARLSTLVVRDGAEPVAILPAELRRGRLSLVGEGPSNYLGPVYDPRRVDAIIPPLSECLPTQRAIRLIDFSGLLDTSPFLTALCTADLPAWSRGVVVRTAVCPCVELRGGWKEVYARRSATFRGNVARKTKALARMGQLEFVESTDPDTVRAALPAMFALFRGRWAGRHESGGFAGHHRAFHEHAAPALAAAGHARLSTLILDGVLVAFHYGIQAGGVTSSYVLGHDNALNVFSPGQLLLVRTLEAAARRGDPEYDFSLGEEAYKETWASGTRGVFRVLRWRRGARGALEASGRRVGAQLWVAARSVEVLRDVRRDGLRRMLGSRPGAPPDSPGLAAGDCRTWRVYRVHETHPAASAKTWTYGTMRARLSPRLLGLAADRAFRGDTLLALASEGRFLGVAWRARDARRSVVAGEIAPADATVYYHPVPGAESSTDVLVRALAGVMENGRPVVVVSGTPVSSAVARPLGDLVARSGSARPTGRAAS